jgi:hypothetical protein
MVATSTAAAAIATSARLHQPSAAGPPAPTGGRM